METPLMEFKKAHDEENLAAKERKIFLLYLAIFLSLFFVCLHYLELIRGVFHDTELVSSIFFLVGSILCIFVFLSLKKPYHVFGLGLRVRRSDWKITLWSTTVISVIMLALKIYLSSKFNVPIFDLTVDITTQHPYHTPLLIGIKLLRYAAFCPLQVFAINGTFQGCILYLFNGKHGRFISIVAATSLFSLIHLVISWLFALAMIFFGLYWAILFCKHRSIIAITASHIIVGIWGLYVLGYTKVFEVLLRHL
jgi:membrane protease YdiL (CAAX protease family)